MVGEKQRQWLTQDLRKVRKDTPIVVFSHSPLQKIYKGWNFWTEDAEDVQALLAPFEQVNVVYGHVHQIQYNQVGSIAFNSVMATAWPWPYPPDPFFERDATGWQFINLATGRPELSFNLYNNTVRKVAWNAKTGRPEDSAYQAEAARIPPQTHY
jgi:hypothetical protein